MHTKLRKSVKNRSFQSKMSALFVVKITVLHILFLFLLDFGNSITYEEFTTITSREQNALNKFRNLVSNQLKSQPAYMNEDLFLIRWLRAKNLDARQAQRMLNEHFKWRKENKIDQINDEDWTEFERETPWYLDGVNKAGFPVAELPFGDWNVRRVALSGKLPKLLRYCFKLFENVEERIRNLRAQGKNVTQWGFIGDIDGFTIQTQACPICTPFYAGYISTLETNYPGAMDKVFAVNTPSSFETVIRLMTPLMRADTRTAMEVFGVNKQQWIKRLDSYIDRDQRSERFGGTKVRDSI